MAIVNGNRAAISGSYRGTPLAELSARCRSDFRFQTINGRELEVSPIPIQESATLTIETPEFNHLEEKRVFEQGGLLRSCRQPGAIAITSYKPTRHPDDETVHG